MMARTEHLPTMLQRERMSLSTRDDGEDRQHSRTVLQREREIIFFRGVTVRMESTHVLGCRERMLSSARDDGEGREHSHPVVHKCHLQPGMTARTESTH